MQNSLPVDKKRTENMHNICKFYLGKESLIYDFRISFECYLEQNLSTKIDELEVVSDNLNYVCCSAINAHL